MKIGILGSGDVGSFGTIRLSFDGIQIAQTIESDRKPLVRLNVTVLMHDKGRRETF